MSNIVKDACKDVKKLDQLLKLGFHYGIAWYNVV